MAVQQACLTLYQVSGSGMHKNELVTPTPSCIEELTHAESQLMQCCTEDVWKVIE
jgi:hypothetical protein